MENELRGAEHFNPVNPQYTGTLRPFDGGWAVKNEQSNEQLADRIAMDNDRNLSLYNEVEARLRNAMHWLPISEDAVFDRSESMLFRLAKYDTTDASGIYHGTYLDMVETYRPFITHYARITEPK